MAHPAAPDRYMPAPPPAPDQPSCQLPKATGGYSRPEDVLSHTTLTLYRKMEVISDAINTCQCTGELNQLFYSLGECIRVIESTQLLRKNHKSYM